MKITILTNVYPNKYGMSDGAFVHNQVKMLEGMGNEVDVLYMDLRSIRKKRKWGFEQYIDGNTRVYHFSVPCGPIPLIFELLYLIMMKVALHSYLKNENKPDIIHGHFYLNGFFAEQIKRKYHIKYVLTEHSSELYEQNIKVMHRWMISKAYDNVDSLICVSEALKRRMRQHTNREIMVIPNVLSKGFYFSKQSKNNDFTFLCIGHIIEGKGMRILVRSFQKIQKIFPNIKLQIVGAGVLREELEKYAYENNLSIAFIGEVSHKMIPRICRSCHCFVLPSEKETFGMVYVEAMACGLPVIATKCGGPEEFVNNENGILIPTNDEDALVNAMIQIYNNYSWYDGEKISKEILERYGSSNIGERLTQVYSENCV